MANNWDELWPIEMQACLKLLQILEWFYERILHYWAFKENYLLRDDALVKALGEAKKEKTQPDSAQMADT